MFFFASFAFKSKKKIAQILKKIALPCHRGKNDNYPMMSCPTDVSNDSFVHAGLFLADLCNFLLVTSAQVFVSAKNLLKITLPGNCHTSAPIMATHVHKVSYER